MVSLVSRFFENVSLTSFPIVFSCFWSITHSRFWVFQHISYRRNIENKFKHFFDVGKKEPFSWHKLLVTPTSESDKLTFLFCAKLKFPSYQVVRKSALFLSTNAHPCHLNNLLIHTKHQSHVPPPDPVLQQQRLNIELVET